MFPLKLGDKKWVFYNIIKCKGYKEKWNETPLTFNSEQTLNRTNLEI